MKIEIHKSQDRGHVKRGWLESYHSFSFGDYYDENKMGFGNLRVINDDYIAPGAGFGRHPHQNMEIITIMLEGILRHQDSMGNASSIRAGEVQVMSAGSGIMHSEINGDDRNPTNLLQIWILPNLLNVEPRYDQKNIKTLLNKNELSEIISPDKNKKTLWIHQDAYFYLGEFDEEKEVEYKIKNPQNGIYFFVIEGEAIIENQNLQKRDAAAISESGKIKFRVKKDSKVLLIES